MGQTVLFDGIAQGVDDVVLAKNVGKSTGTVFSGKDLIAHAAECREE